jgi:hypothetical protein
MIDIVYSLPVHENREVVIDQINNINKYNKHLTIKIVLHLSQRFYLTNDEITSITNLSNVLVNQERLITGYIDGSLFEAHLSNINCIYQNKLEFDHIVFLSSNMMFIRQMWKLESDFIGTSFEAIEHRGWSQGWMASRDRGINNFPLFGCQIEGLFISKRLLDKMLVNLNRISHKYLFKNIWIVKLNEQIVKVIRQFRKYRIRRWAVGKNNLSIIRFFTFSMYQPARIAYATEEVYFPTIAKLYESQFRFSGKELSFQDWLNKFILTTEDIDLLSSNSSQIYSCTKRVDRIYNDPIRTYIRNLPE